MKEDKNVAYATRLVKKWNYSLFQVESKLIKKGLKKKDIQLIINYLKNSSILNDENIFYNVIETYNYKNYGYVRILEELNKKGFSKELLSSYVEDKELELMKARKQFLRLTKRYNDYKDNLVTLNKLINALKRLGFTYSTIRELTTEEKIYYEDVE